jgi:hypothetical protein
MASKTGLEACNQALLPDIIQAVIKKKLLNYLSHLFKIYKSACYYCCTAAGLHANKMYKPLTLPDVTFLHNITMTVASEGSRR